MNMLRENNIKPLPTNDHRSVATESPGTSSTSVPITRFSARAQTSRIKLSLGNSSTDRTRRQTGKVECRVSFSPSVSFRECATRFAYKDENSNSSCVSLDSGCRVDVRFYRRSYISILQRRFYRGSAAPLRRYFIDGALLREWFYSNV
jgi:hypothetical protein